MRGEHLIGEVSSRWRHGEGDAFQTIKRHKNTHKHAKSVVYLFIVVVRATQGLQIRHLHLQMEELMCMPQNVYFLITLCCQLPVRLISGSHLLTGTMANGNREIGANIIIIIMACNYFILPSGCYGILDVKYDCVDWTISLLTHIKCGFLTDSLFFGN